MTHHVMNRGGRHGPIFLDDEDYESFVELLGVISLRLGVEVLAYALMGNHFHLLLHCPKGNLAKAMQYLCSVYVRRFNARHGFDGPLFRGRYESVLILDDAHLMVAARYVHRNPLDLARMMDLTRYERSSYGVYVGAQPQPWWLKRRRVLELFDSDPEKLRDFTESVFPQDSSTADPRAQTARDWTTADAGQPSKPVNDAPGEVPTLDRIARAVQQVVTNGPGKRGPTNQRLAVVRIGYRAGFSPASLADFLGVSTSTIWSDVRRVECLSRTTGDFALQSKKASHRAWRLPERELL